MPIRLTQQENNTNCGVVITGTLSETQEKETLSAYGRILGGMARILTYSIPLDEKLQLLKKSWQALEEFQPN